MKKILFAVAAAAVLIGGSAFLTGPDDGNEILPLGKKAPMSDVKMMDVSGSKMALTDMAKESGLLVVFSCNTCPFVVGATGYGDGWEGRYNELSDAAEALNVGMVLINSNEAKRDGADSMEAMKERAKEQSYKCPYVEDKDHKLADAFGAKTTPHVFLFDGDLKLAYKGAIDDSNLSPDKVENKWLSNAMMKMIKGEKIDPNSTRQKGCSIKRVKS